MTNHKVSRADAPQATLLQLASGIERKFIAENNNPDLVNDIIKSESVLSCIEYAEKDYTGRFYY